MGSSITPLSFTGVSVFSADFQTILARAQSIASLPLQALQNQKADLLQREALTTTLQGLATSFSASLESLASVGDASGISATSSDSSIVSAGTVTATSAAVYTISEITSVAQAASETSLSGYASSTATSVSATGTVRLTIGATQHTITLAAEENNLAGIRDKINALGAGVTASIFTTGTGATPNYLSLTADQTGAAALTLIDDPAGAATALITSANQGANADFKLNGVSVSKSSNVVNDVVSGLTFTIADVTSPGETVTLTLASDRAKLKTALSSLVGAYNNLSDFLDSQIGESAGLLSGSTLITQTSAALRQFVNFNGSGSIKSISDLGLTLDSQGTLAFDAAVFDALSTSQIADGFVYAGTTSEGLGSLLSDISSIADPITGLVKIEQDQSDRTENYLTSQIDTLTERITAQQNALRSRLQVADTLLAALESQKNILTASIDSLNLSLFGRNDR